MHHSPKEPEIERKAYPKVLAYSYGSVVKAHRESIPNYDSQ